jgi:dTMP kinase
MGKTIVNHNCQLPLISTRVELSPHNLPGVLIIFSGSDGSGKSTTISLVRRYLRSRRIKCVAVAALSKQCRNLPYFQSYVADPTCAMRGTVNLPALCLVCLGDRLMTVHTRVIPLLRLGTWVLQDRYIYTSLAELLTAGCTNDEIEAVKQVATRFPAPDLAVLTTVGASEAIRRIKLRPKERDIPLDFTFYDRLVQAYKRVAEENDLITVKTDQSRELVFETLKPQLDALIEQRSSARL